MAQVEAARSIASRRRYHPPMAASGRSFDPTSPPQAPGPVVDYRLARQSLILSVRQGLISTTDVCDAHPELLRAARNIGDETQRACPMCSHEAVRFVRYVYGDELGRNSGRVVYPAEWLQELVEEYEHFTCYVVEVCVDCAWNHLVRSYVTGHGYGPAEPNRERAARRTGGRRERG